MLPPFLFVGIGGSGGDTLRHLYRELDLRLRQVGIRTMPDGWQFVHIDCGSTEEHSMVPVDNYRHKYIGMASRGVSYGVIDEALSERSPAVRGACLGWRPDPSKVHVTITEGAGQYRAIGRMVAAVKLGDIRATLASLAEQVDGADLAEVSRAFGVPIDDGQARPTAVVFSSLAGGTGAGTFLDVCDVLRGIGYDWCADPVSILYGPDVFGGFRAEQARGIHANALATVSELLAGYWIGDPTEDPIHRAAGVHFQAGRRSGPAYTFLVGSKNESGRLHFNDHQDVFAVVARTVAAWTTSKLLQQQVSSYLVSNWQQGAQLADPLGLAENPLDMPFSALGYASLGLGRHLFHRYVAQCLAKVAAGRLLHGSKGVDVYDTTAEPDTTEIVRLDCDRFAAAMIGLPGPVGSATGDLGEGLRVKLHPNRRQALDTMKARVRDRIGAASLPRGEWRNRVITEVRQQETEFVHRQLDIVHRQAEAWIDAIQQVVHDEMLRSLSIDGLVAARDLVVDTIRRLREEVPALELAAGTDRAEAERLPAEVELALGPERRTRLRFGSSLLPPNNERVIQAVDRAVDTMGRKADAEVRMLCSRLLSDFADRMLGPAVEALNAGLHALRADTVSTRNGRPAPVSTWPQGPAFSVPQGLRPSRNQFLVDYVEHYPAVFGQQIVRAVPDAKLADDAIITAVRDILLTPPGLPDLLEPTATWQPRLMRNRTDATRTEQPGGFRLHVSASDLLDRCMAWADRAPSLGSYLNQDLAGALGTDRPTAEQQRRLHRYEEKLVLALTASDPLVSIDASYRAKYVSQTSAAYTPLITQIPLRQGSLAYERTRELLRQHTILTDDRLDDLFGESQRDEIEFTSFLSSPCHPMAFSSLMDPIHIDWRERSDDPVARDIFAKWRRARPLTRAVPLPPEVRRSIVRGFLIEALINPPRLTDSRRSLVLTGQHGLTMEFALIGRVPDVTDLLDAMAAVLESVPLALLESRDRRAPAILGYRHLMEVSQPPYDRLFGSEALDLPARIAKLASDSRDRLADQVSDQLIDRVWELRADIRAGLDDLTRALEGGQR